MPFVRPATPSDLCAIANLDAIDPQSPWQAAALTPLLHSPSHLVWVSTLDQEIAGFLLAQHVLDEGELWMVRTAPHAQRQGHARALLDALTAHWRAHGVTHAFLEVRTDNTPATALYLSSGWRELTTRKAYYRDGTDAKILRWDAARAPNR